MPFRYRVFGVVREAESGRPLAGLSVRAFDKDVLADDELVTLQKRTPQTSKRLEVH